MTWLQLIGSLVAVLAVTLAVRLMGLGEAQLADAGEACELAEAMIHGFHAEDAIVCGAGKGALVQGSGSSEFVVLKKLGSQYAARPLVPPITTSLEKDNVLHIESRDRFFGRVGLTFPDEKSRAEWRSRLEHAR